MESSVAVRRADNSSGSRLAFTRPHHRGTAYKNDEICEGSSCLLVVGMITVSKDSCLKDRSIWVWKTWSNLLCRVKIVLKEIGDEQVKFWL